MKVGIDNYCYHRFFGEVYPEQTPPQKGMTLEGFLKRAKELKVDGVSLESIFIPRFDREYLSELKGMLDEYKLDRVFAWGHPDGLEGGKNKKMLDDIIKSIEYADAIGAKVLNGLVAIIITGILIATIGFYINMKLKTRKEKIEKTLYKFYDYR